MMKLMMGCLFLLLVLPKVYALDGKVIKLVGDVTWVNASHGAKKIGVGDLVTMGAIIKSASKSFVKIVLSDQTAMTIGPNSEMELTTQPDGQSGMINIISGKLRAQVAEGNKVGPPKFVVKTPRVSMGVRGTDFRVDYNPSNAMSGLLTFDGQVQMGKVGSSAHGVEPFTGGTASVMVGPGQFSTESPQLQEVMMPVVINPAQMEQLSSNTTFVDSEAVNTKKFDRPVPPGVDGALFAADKNVVAKSLGVDLRSVSQAPVLVSMDGPLPGGFFSEKAGYIPPPENSRIDENTGLPIPSTKVGSVDETGNYLAPEGLKLTDAGQFVVESSAVKVSLDDIPNVVGAAQTTSLVSEAGVPISASTETGPEQATQTSSTREGERLNSATNAETLSDTMAAVDELAAELTEEIIQSTLDDMTDTQNTTTTNTTTTVTMTIGDIQ